MHNLRGRSIDPSPDFQFRIVLALQVKYVQGTYIIT